MPRSRSRRRRRDEDAERGPPAERQRRRRKEVERAPPPEPASASASPPPERPERRRRRKKQLSPSESEDESSSAGIDDVRNERKERDGRWVCGTCGGPHRTKDCPMSANPMSMMMGMMGNPMMSRMPMPGMPPMMGMPGMPPVPGMAPSVDNGRRRKQKSRKSRNDSSSDDARSSGKHHAKEPIPEVDKFLEENRINEEAASKIRALSPESQHKLISRPLTGDVQNPSKVMIARVRELQSQNEKVKGNDAWGAWNSAMMGVSPEAVQKYVDDNSLDESACRQMRSLPSHLQAQAVRWDLSSYKNASAKFMKLASNLSSARMPMHGMAHMAAPGMPMLPGWPPHGMPGWPGMPHMGMPQMGMPMPGIMPPLGDALGPDAADDF